MDDKKSLSYTFHNPNNSAKTAQFLLDILIEANKDTVDKLLSANAVANESHNSHNCVKVLLRIQEQVS
ncbi:MAG: hypothetical protein GX061_07550 [Eubacteriaceae bacterium]|nr:hypothetical protein [Eubacteriaceae bacterium]